MTEKENVTEVLDLGKTNLNIIEYNLWLGNLSAASDPQLLEEKKIYSILTVNSFPLPRKVLNLKHIQTHFICVFDSPRDDLLSHFEEAHQFIENGLKRGGVLVHCYLGVSRSATIILAYLMRKNGMTLKAALKYVKCHRPSIGPNPGFLAQLKLYEIMQYKIDKTNVQYKMFRLYIAIDHVKKNNTLPECYSDIIKPDPMLVTVNLDSKVFKCKKCRRILARGLNIIPHSTKEKYSWRNSKWTYNLEKSEICQEAYFIEPLAWMQDITLSLEGKLHCPNTTCRNKLGSFNWVSGCQCPCGTRVSPGFCLNSSKVDKQNIVIMSSNLKAIKK